MSRAHLLGSAAAVLCIMAAFLLWQTNSRAAQSIGIDVASGVSDPASEASISAQYPAVTPPSGFAMDDSSLRGTEVDGGVSFDANGDVLPDTALRRLFDYYLSLVGERHPAQIRELLKDHLLSRYGLQRAQSVLSYFDRYVGFLQRLAESKIGQSIDPHDRLAKVWALRREMLGDEMASAFFSEEEALAAFTLERMVIAADSHLTKAQKSQRLADLDRSSGHTARAEADIASIVADQDSRLDRANASVDRRAAERETLWGKEAAGRLAQLDEQRAQWDARIEQYLLVRSRIDADRSLSAAARAQALAALRAERFDAAEQRRIASLEAIGQLKAGG